jgi:hypothetical protein
MYEWIEPSDFVYQTIDLVQAQEPKNKVSEAGRRVIGWAGASLWLAHQRARLHASTRTQQAGRIGTASLRGTHTVGECLAMQRADQGSYMPGTYIYTAPRR